MSGVYGVKCPNCDGVVVMTFWPSAGPPVVEELEGAPTECPECNSPFELTPETPWVQVDESAWTTDY